MPVSVIAMILFTVIIFVKFNIFSKKHEFFGFYNKRFSGLDYVNYNLNGLGGFIYLIYIFKINILGLIITRYYHHYDQTKQQVKVYSVHYFQYMLLLAFFYW